MALTAPKAGPADRTFALALTGTPEAETLALESLTRCIMRRVSYTGVNPDDVVARVVDRLILDDGTLTNWRHYHIADAFLLARRKRQRELLRLQRLQTAMLRRHAEVDTSLSGLNFEEREERAHLLRLGVRLARQRYPRLLLVRRYLIRRGLRLDEAIKLAGYRRRGTFFDHQRALERACVELLKRRRQE